MAQCDFPYRALLDDVIRFGEHRTDRTGTGTTSLFARSASFDLQQGFPLLTTKSVHVKSVFAELFWFLSGSTNVADLQKRGCRIWDEWALADGTIGPGYGKQWRDFGGRDQIRYVLETLRDKPDSRQAMMSAWNPAELPDMALPPCHVLAQFSVRKNGLSCAVYQRSADIFLGVPFNIASYALLTHLLANELGLPAARLEMTFGDLHLYDNHVKQAETLLARRPKDFECQLNLPNPVGIDRFCEETRSSAYPEQAVYVTGYDPHPAIKAPVAV